MVMGSSIRNTLPADELMDTAKQMDADPTMQMPDHLSDSEKEVVMELIKGLRAARMRTRMPWTKEAKPLMLSAMHC